MERKDLVIVGAGGFGKEVLWQLNEVNDNTDTYHILGFIDDSPSLQGAQINGLPVLGNGQWLLNYQRDICAVICVGNTKHRRIIYERLKENPHISFPTIIAENVKCSDFVKFGQGCILCLSSILTVNITLGDFVISNFYCTIGHDTVLDDFVTLHPRVTISGNVYIGAGAEIGTGTDIIQGKHIGENAVIDAGSVVVKDIPTNCAVVGTPEKPMR